MRRGSSRGGEDAVARGLSDAVLLALGAVLGSLFGLASLRLVLTSLSEVDYGRYCLFHVVAGVLTVLLAWPAHGVLRLGAEEVLETARVGRTYGSLLALTCISALLAGAGAALAGEHLNALMEHPAWPLALAFAVLSAVATLGYALLQPIGKVGARTILPAVTRGAYAGLLALVVLGDGAPTLQQTLVLCAASVVPGVALGWALVGRRMGRPSLHRETLSRGLSFGWPLLLRNLGTSGVLYVDVLVVRSYLGVEDAGRYDVAYRLAEQVIVLGLVLEFVVGPILAEAAARKDPGPLRRFYRLLAPQLTLLWGLGAALLIALAEPLLALLGAKSPEASARVLEVLALAVALRGAIVLEVAVFDAHLLSRWPTIAFFLGFSLNLVLDIGLLESGWGLAAPALATALGFALQGALRARAISQRFGVNAFRPYLGIVPALAVLGVHLATGRSAAVTLLAWAVAVVLALALGRKGGLFPAEARPYLERVRMPAGLRRALLRLHSEGGAA